MNFQQKLENYAEILVVHGLNVQKGQIVNISTETINRDFALLVAERAYKRGAKFVNIDLSDARLERVRILHSSEKDLNYVPTYISPKYNELVDTNGANIRIISPEDPDILSDLDGKKLNTVRLNRRLALDYFYDHGIGRSKVHWTVAAAATPNWGLKLFPKETPQKACELLWDQIFKICRADQTDYLQAWREHNQTLHARAKRLTELKIKDLHFTGPGTDLHVGLSSKAVFKGGGEASPLGVEFEPNVPTEECFTTPDWRLTSGKLSATRPFLVNGKLIKDLKLEFKNGEIIGLSASDGEETFREYMNSDAGGKRLGEVALVGIDSPIFQSGLVFEEILFDENAACHVAIGSAYKFCLEGGPNMEKQELESLGCNDSSVHTDMMISSEKVDVSALTFDGKKIDLIKAGAWVWS